MGSLLILDLAKGVSKQHPRVRVDLELSFAAPQERGSALQGGGAAAPEEVERIEVALVAERARARAANFPAVSASRCKSEVKSRSTVDGGKWLHRSCMAFGWLAAMASAEAQATARQHRQYVITDLPGGKAAVPIATSEKVRLLLSRTRPGQFYFQAIWPALHAPLGLRNPTYVDVVGRDDATRPEFVARAVDDLEAKRGEYILWAPFLERPEPGPECAYHLAPLVRYLHARYARVELLGDEEELWRRTN